MLYSNNELPGYEDRLACSRVNRYFISGAWTPLRPLAIAGVFLCVAPSANAIVVTPVSSNYTANSQIDVSTDTDPLSQGPTLNTLSPFSTLSDGGLTMTVNGSATWANPSSLTVNMDLFRPDDEPFGTSKSFSGEGIFNYTFSVPSDTTVTVDYAVLGTSTYTDVALNSYVWWAMQPYYISIDGSIIESIIFPGVFDPYYPPPFLKNGTVVANVTAGTHTIRINASHGATGNQPGDREMTGSFEIQIGPVPTLEGDLDGDGFVGITDLNIVLGNWNQTIPPGDPLADPSGDNFVGIEDLNTVLGNWNAGTPPGDTANIPEPGTLGLLTPVLAGLLRRRRR
jgi:hypothetical protein